MPTIAEERLLNSGSCDVALSRCHHFWKPDQMLNNRPASQDGRYRVALCCNQRPLISNDFLPLSASPRDTRRDMKGQGMRYLILVDSHPDPATSFFADLSEAKRHAERKAAEHAHADIYIEGYPASGGPMATWRYDRDVASWVSTS